MATAIETHAYGVARALGISVTGSAVEAVVQHCERAVLGMAEGFNCTSLDDLRLATANGLKTHVLTIASDDELDHVQATYVARKELGFATLKTDLAPTVYGQTIRLLHRQKGERPYVSIIDARGDKAARACFTEWHEYSHLLALTDPAREKFQRSHGIYKPPEEALMDAIAARVGFLDPIFVPHLPQQLTFASISALRAAACPSASWTSLFSAVARVWPKPVIVVRAEVEVKKALRVPVGQGDFGFFPAPVGQLRAVQAIGNAAARTEAFRIHSNMRVPGESTIARAFADTSIHEGIEDLHQWESSKGGALDTWPVYVIARATAGGVDALVISQR